MIITNSSWPRTCWPLSLAVLTLASPAVLAAQSGGTVAGVVSTADGNRPVERATISVSGRNVRATTDVSGRYQIGELPAGSYWIVARAIGLLPDSVQLSIVDGQTTRGDLALKRSTTTLQQVAITAQKRSESVQDVPVAVTALTADFLTKQSIQQFDALSAYVPGLNVQLQSPNNPGFVIRGITSDDGTSYVEPRVSVFQDGVSISKSRGSVVELFDLERVEVLKGPQGTLFGRGAQIGAVHVIQNKAVNKRESSVAIGGGTFNELYANGVVNAPLVQLLNKSRGAGFSICLAAQTVHDYEARLGTAAAARMLLGNPGNVIALRTADLETQRFCAGSLAPVSIESITQSRSTGIRPPFDDGVASSSIGIRRDLREVPLFAPEWLGLLPDLHFVARIAGGRTVKGELPRLVEPARRRAPARAGSRARGFAR